MLEWQSALWGSYLHRVYTSQLCCNSETSLCTGLPKPKKFVCLSCAYKNGSRGLSAVMSTYRAILRFGVQMPEPTKQPGILQTPVTPASTDLPPFFCPLSRHRLAHSQTFLFTNTLIFWKDWRMTLTPKQIISRCKSNFHKPGLCFPFSGAYKCPNGLAWATAATAMASLAAIAFIQNFECMINILEVSPAMLFGPCLALQFQEKLK